MTSTSASDRLVDLPTSADDFLPRVLSDSGKSTYRSTGFDEANASLGSTTIGGAVSLRERDVG